jgi:hypothetical protein
MSGGRIAGPGNAHAATWRSGAASAGSDAAGGSVMPTADPGHEPSPADASCVHPRSDDVMTDELRYPHWLFAAQHPHAVIAMSPPLLRATLRSVRHPQVFLDFR